MHGKGRVDMIPRLPASCPDNALRTILARIVERGSVEEHEFRIAGRSLVERTATGRAEGGGHHVPAICMEQIVRRRAS